MAGVRIFYDSTCTSTSDISCTWTVPAGTCRVTFEIWGGGGGGGNKGTNCDCCSRGGSGSGGGYAKKTVDTTPGCQYTIVVGKAGVSSQGYGSFCGICCDGCAGGTTYVNGQGLSNFCATGGLGGKSDFGSNCYGHCGCNWYSQCPGCGVGGDINARGFTPTVTRYGSDNPYNIVVKAGGAGGPGGGAGGYNGFGGYNNNSGYCALIGEHNFHGRIPGGGGAGSGGHSDCVCTPFPPGRGGPGMVKITF